MKTLTIRLTDEDEKALEKLQDMANSTTLNATIRYAIHTAHSFEILLKELREAFRSSVEVDQAKFKELNEKYGLLQSGLFR